MGFLKKNIVEKAKVISTHSVFEEYVEMTKLVSAGKIAYFEYLQVRGSGKSKYSFTEGDYKPMKRVVDGFEMSYLYY